MMEGQVSHEELMEKLTEHEDAILSMGQDIKAINGKLDPIVRSLRSIAQGFKALIVLGALSAALVAILELADRFG